LVENPDEIVSIHSFACAKTSSTSRGQKRKGKIFLRIEHRQMQLVHDNGSLVGFDPSFFGVHLILGTSLIPASTQATYSGLGPLILKRKQLEG
jgi:hypothetical protein